MGPRLRGDDTEDVARQQEQSKPHKQNRRRLIDRRRLNNLGLDGATPTQRYADSASFGGRSGSSCA